MDVANTAVAITHQSPIIVAAMMATIKDSHHDKQKSQCANSEIKSLPWTCNHSTMPTFLNSNKKNDATNATATAIIK